MLTLEQKQKLIEYVDKADYYKSIGDYKSAIACYENFLSIDPTKEAVYSIIANLYSKIPQSDTIEKQVYYYKKLFERNSKSRIAIHGLAFGYEKLNKKDLAEYYYKLLLENNPTEIDYYNYGMFLIHNGDFLNGHKYFTHRFKISDNPLLCYPIKTISDKRWDFQADISDKTLLVHYEQGFGDSIMYCRFIPELKKICKKLVFVVQKELYELIMNSEIISSEVDIVTSFEGINYDYSMGLLDAPLALKTTVENIPFVSGYLDAIKKDYEGNFKIGIAYSGDKSANYDERDINIEYFSFLSNISGVKIYSFSADKDDSLDWVQNLGCGFKNFCDTASALKGMDLVISTDNVILNLAGALGVKTIGLFNRETNYRWYKTSADNVGWYNSVKPIQCIEQNNWNNLYPRIEQAIRLELT